MQRSRTRVAVSPLDKRFGVIIARYVARLKRVADAEVRRRVPAAVKEAMRQVRRRP